MEPESVKELIANGIPDAKIEVIDTTGTKDHFGSNFCPSMTNH